MTNTDTITKKSESLLVCKDFAAPIGETIICLSSDNVLTVLGEVVPSVSIVDSCQRYILPYAHNKKDGNTVNRFCLEKFDSRGYWDWRC